MQPANLTSRSAAETTRLIKAEAARLGFNLVGVTTPDPPPHFSVYQEWLAAGRHGEMAYLASERAVERRSDPRIILPECRSILVLGVGYHHPASPSGGLQGRTASYALGLDYHLVLEDRLKALAAYCETLSDGPFTCRWYTDTGPILERDLAQRAGLGWIGKNTCLINPHAGSFFLLSEILLSLELEYDAPFITDHCGTCRRCIEACPTSCILPDRTLDARRCLAYLTIEQKGPIPIELRPDIGEWIFGCDICQEVCPWNQRFARPTQDPAFQPREEHLMDLPDLLRLSPEAFNRRYKDSAIQRTKRRGLLRSAAVVSGNLSSASDLQVISALEAALHDAEPLVRSHAAWALGRAAGQGARAALQAALLAEQDESVRKEIEQALETLGA